MLCHSYTQFKFGESTEAMCLVLKPVLTYLCLICGVALHGSGMSTCTCPETCQPGTDDQASMSCLFHADHSSLTARRLPKWVLPAYMLQIQCVISRCLPFFFSSEAVCTNYDILKDPITQEPYCEFVGRHEPIADMCQPAADGSLCIIQNPNQKLQR